MSHGERGLRRSLRSPEGRTAGSASNRCRTVTEKLPLLFCGALSHTREEVRFAAEDGHITAIKGYSFYCCFSFNGIMKAKLTQIEVENHGINRAEIRRKFRTHN
jgi:hypothetical protein